MKVVALREMYREVFGDDTRANNRQWLVKRIAWRLQANALGGLSERAKRRAAELANDADVRVLPPRTLKFPDLTPRASLFWLQRKSNKTPELNCPGCKKFVGGMRHLVVATKCCPHCGKKILNDVD